MSDESILQRLEALGHEGPRVHLRGTTPSTARGGRYEIGEEFARGGVGAIHRGRDNDVGREVALKVLHGKHVGSPEFVQRFVEEAQIGGQLQHPGIVPVYELGLLEDNRPFFAMKLVKGETLAARLAARAGRADDLRLLLGVFRDLCRTMAYAHARGVVHRDLKPANVMIGSFGEVQVVDWGLGKVLRKGGIDDERLRQRAHDARTMISTVRSEGDDGDSLTGSVMGTPAYMPPEQALGEVESIDEKSDVFSLGAILCEILTGAPPYEGAPGECLAMARKSDVESARARLAGCDADERLIALCRDCLEPLPAKRPRGAEVLADEVAAHLAASEGRAHRAELEALEAKARAAVQAVARRQTRLVALGSLAVVLVALTSWLVLDRGARERAREREASIQSALQETERLRSAGRFDGALAAAERARDLGDTSGLAAEVAAEATRVAAEASVRAKEAALLVVLEDLRGRWGTGNTPGSTLASGADLDRPARQARLVDEAFTAAFVDAFGGVSESVDRLRTTPHAEAIAASVAHWSWLRRTVSGSTTNDTVSVDALADALDPRNAGLRGAFRTQPGDSRLAWLGALEKPLPVALAPEVAFVLLQDGHLEEARDLLRRQHVLHPDHVWIHLRLADVAERLGESGRALDHATAALTIEAASLPALLRLARARLREGALDEAALAYERASEIDPDDPMAPLGLGAVRLARGQAEDAAALFRRAATLDPENAVAWRNLGTTLRVNHDHAGALAAFEKAVALDPDYAAAYDDLGQILLRRHDPAAAIAAFRRGLAAAPRSTSLNVHLSEALVETRAFEAAVVAARDAVRAAPLDAGAHAALGHALIARRESPAAKTSFRRALDLDGQCAEAWLGLGRIYRDTGGRRRDARAALKKAVAADSKNLRARELLGRVLGVEFGETDAAVPQFQAILAVDPTYASAQGWLAEILVLDGRGPASIEAARAAVRIDPKSADAQTALAYVLSVSEGLKGRALGAAARLAAHRLDPDNTGRLLQLAKNRRMRGHLEEAKSAIDKALALQPDAYRLNAESWEIERYLRWRPKLAALRSGEIEPTSSVDLLAVAWLFRIVEGDLEQYLHFCRKAIPFELRGGFITGGMRYEAARAAVLVGPGHHAEALGWLREELVRLRRVELTNRPHALFLLLRGWRLEADFRSVGDGPDVSDEWRAFWADLDKLISDAQAGIH